MDETIIKKVTACQVFSGRGYPAIEATVVTDSGKKGTVQCVSGLSVGSHEVAFAYDGGSQWRGMGLHTAVRGARIAACRLFAASTLFPPT